VGPEESVLLGKERFYEVIMRERTRWYGYVFILSVAATAFSAQDKPEPRRLQSVAPVLRQPSMKVFRRFSVDPQAMHEFYGKVLGLKNKLYMAS
jgi:hypothetical protein